MTASPFAENKILAHLPILGQYVSGDTYPPIQVEIDLTNACSSACPWCAGYREREDNPFVLFGTGATKEEQWDNSRAKTTQLLYDLSEYGAKSMTWTGGGDPTMHPFLPELVECSWSFGMDNGLITNGVVDVTECLPHCEWVRFSVDAGTERGYEQQHGRKGHFSKVLKNVQRAANNKGATTIGVACITSHEVVHELEDFVRLWTDIPVDYIQFRPLLDTHGKRFFSDDSRTLDALRRAADLDPRVVISEAKYAGYSGTGKTERCHGIYLETAIAADGCVYACCHLKGNPQYSLGSLYEESFQKIWERHLENREFHVTDDCVAFCRHYGSNRFFEEHVLTERQHRNFI